MFSPICQSSSLFPGKAVTTLEVPEPGPTVGVVLPVGSPGAVDAPVPCLAYLRHRSSCSLGYMRYSCRGVDSLAPAQGRLGRIGSRTQRQIWFLGRSSSPSCFPWTKMTNSWHALPLTCSYSSGCRHTGCCTGSLLCTQHLRLLHHSTDCKGLEEVVIRKAGHLDTTKSLEGSSATATLLTVST